MTKTYLLEIGCEEIPARFMAGLLEDLQAQLRSQLSTMRLSFEGITTMGTYRRLTVKLTGLPDGSESVTIQMRGPITSVAYAPDGSLTPAGLGFAKRNNVDESALFQGEEGGKSYLFAKLYRPGQPTAALLAQAVPAAINALSLPIAMKWGNGVGPFIRPVHWVLSLLDTQVVPFTLFGIAADRTTYGHRLKTQHPDLQTHVISGHPIPLDHADHYENLLLEKGRVHVTAARALLHIIPQLVAAGYTLQHQGNDPLADEVYWLTEDPKVLKGTFDPAYLVVPQEVLMETMVTNQRYFPLVDADGKLKAEFAFVADNVTDTNAATIIAGNEKVLKARLDDARFFWEEDCKTTLADKAAKLSTITFQKGLGSMADKVDRVEKLSDYLCKIFYPGNAEMARLTRRTAQLCKADLTSHMVYEFSSLQGIMGGHYARRDGEDTRVCKGLAEHYQMSTTEPSGALVLIADRLDTLAACFCNNLIPTGSQDPWALRRAVLAIRAQLLALQGIAAPIEPLSLTFALGHAFDQINPDRPNFKTCLDFCLDRVTPGASVSHYVLDDFYRAYFMSDRQSELAGLEDTSKAALLETAIRIKRITKGMTAEQPVDPGLFSDPIETEAHTLYIKIHARFHQCQTPFNELATLSPVMIRYFKDVMVMHEDPKIRQNRLAFLERLNALYLSAADFELV